MWEAGELGFVWEGVGEIVRDLVFDMMFVEIPDESMKYIELTVFNYNLKVIKHLKN